MASPFQGLDFLVGATQGVALGWHVCGPLALRVCHETGYAWLILLGAAALCRFGSALHIDAPHARMNPPGMSTLAEIEQAIEQLAPEQWAEVRRWMDAHRPKMAQGQEMAGFDEWLAGSTGIARGKLATDERMRETRGKD